MLRPEAVRKFRLGCTFNGYDGRLDTIFLLPTPEVAKENLLVKVLGHLVVRYQVEQQYKLPDLLLEVDDELMDGVEDDDDEEEEDMGN